MQRAKAGNKDSVSGAFYRLDGFLQASIPGIFPAGVVLVMHGGEILFHKAYGTLDPGVNQYTVHPGTLFDLASLTKLFTATAFMRLVDAGSVSLQTPVAEVIPGFSGLRPIGPREDPLSGAWLPADPGDAGRQVDLARINFRHLLTHTSGLTPWRSIYRVDAGVGEAPLPHQVSQAARARRISAVSAYDFACPTGEQILYSDLGFILLGEAVGRLSGVGLEHYLQEELWAPLGLQKVCFNPLAKGIPLEQIAPTGKCAWRRRLLHGEVNDENAASLGGVSGHAGLYSTAEEVARLGQIYLQGGRFAGLQILEPETVDEMIRQQVAIAGQRRGLAWVLWTPQDCAGGPSFGPQSFGHTGFTGTSLWIDPEQELLVVALTNRVYNGREDLAGIQAFRPRLHEMAVEALRSPA
jgi:CubicO group peptidase (beta-lactamase class C family)